MHHEMVDCHFDDNDLSNYDIVKWPELVELYEMWKWNQDFRLGEQWTVSVPAGRLVKEFQDGGSTPDVRSIVQPLLDAVQEIPLTHTYLLSVFAINDLPCSSESLQKIVNLLLKKWHRSIVAPGEMVGTIAAQSVGEPTMQSKFFFWRSRGPRPGLFLFG